MFWTWFWNVEIVVGVALQILVLLALSKGPYRSYPIVFAYSLVAFLTTLINYYGYHQYAASRMSGRAYARIYWVDDIAVKLLIFFLVLSLIYKASERNPKRASLVRMLALGAGIVVVVSYFYGAEALNSGRRFTQAGRNLSFYAALANMVLWAALVRIRNKDRQLYLVTAGLGLQLAAEAIGYSLSLFIPQSASGLLNLPNLIVAAGSLLCLTIWWQTFRRDNVPIHLAETAR